MFMFVAGALLATAPSAAQGCITLTDGVYVHLKGQHGPRECQREHGITREVHFTPGTLNLQLDSHQWIKIAAEKLQKRENCLVLMDPAFRPSKVFEGFPYGQQTPHFAKFYANLKRGIEQIHEWQNFGHCAKCSEYPKVRLFWDFTKGCSEASHMDTWMRCMVLIRADDRYSNMSRAFAAAYFLLKANSQEEADGAWNIPFTDKTYYPCLKAISKAIKGKKYPLTRDTQNGILDTLENSSRRRLVTDRLNRLEQKMN